MTCLSCWLSRNANHIWLWFNKHMTVILVGIGSSLIAAAMFMLSKATEPSAFFMREYLCGAFMSIIMAFVAYGLALMRESKKEGIQRELDREREEREAAREERDIERHNAYMVINGWTKDFKRDKIS